MSDVTIAQLQALVLPFVTKYFKSRNVNLPSIVAAGAAFIESVSQSQSMTSEQKLDLAKQSIPVIVSAAVSLGWLTAAQAAQINQDVANGADLVENIIETVVDVANNPNVIQAGSWVKAHASCFGSC